MDWLDAAAEDILEDVLEAKILSGEDIDPTSERVRRRVIGEILCAQDTIRSEASISDDGRILVHRALVLDEEAIASLSPEHGLGESWAFSERGAHPYDAVRRGRTVVISGLVHPDDLLGHFVLAMWSSGEGEARLRRNAEIEIVSMTARGIGGIRDDLKGTVFGVVGIPAPPRP